MELEAYKNEGNYDNKYNGGYGRNDKIKNKTEVELYLCGKKHIVESNEVEARKVEITVVKEQNCNFAFCGDDIEYTVRITNKSDVELKNVKFKDELNDDLDFERNSFKVNNKKENVQFNDHTISYMIPELKGKQCVTITFSCKVCYDDEK